MSRGLLIPLLALALLGSVAQAAYARVPPARLSSSTSAWKQIVPLLRKKTATRGKGKGFDFRPTLRVHTASGYRVEVTELGGTIAVIIGRPEGAVITVGQPEGAVTAYLARGVTTSRRLQADFGSFGELDMHFRPSRHLAPLPPRHHCRGGIQHPKRRGVWVGSFRFAGEGGYVSIRIHRAPGSIRREALVCAHPHFFVRRSATASSGPFSSFVPRKELTAGWRHGLESTQLLATTLLFHPIFIARSEAALGSVGLLRLAVVAKRTGKLVVNDSLTHAEAEAPAPFHGVGVYTASPDGTRTWTGDLTVDFPGAPSFPLTGEEFKAEVQRPLSGASR